jgi:hypothetical protein
MSLTDPRNQETTGKLCAASPSISDNAKVTGESIFTGNPSSLSGNAHAHNVNLTACTLSGNAEVANGTHMGLTATDNASLHGCTTMLKSTISGNVKVHGNILVCGGKLSGNVEINDFGAAGDPRPVFPCNNGDRLYNTTYLAGTTAASGKAVIKELTYSSLAIINANGDYSSLRICLNGEAHTENNPRCHCLLWLPLLLVCDPIATHYFLRVGGKLQPMGEGHKSVYAEDSIRNPYNAFSYTNLETLMRKSLEELPDKSSDDICSLLLTNIEAHNMGDIIPDEYPESLLSQWADIIKVATGTNIFD